jgi:hypothetical protein
MFLSGSKLTNLYIIYIVKWYLRLMISYHAQNQNWMPNLGWLMIVKFDVTLKMW